MNKQKQHVKLITATHAKNLEEAINQFLQTLDGTVFQLTIDQVGETTLLASLLWSDPYVPDPFATVFNQPAEIPFHKSEPELIEQNWSICRAAKSIPE